jgi:hypothetical protein
MLTVIVPCDGVRFTSPLVRCLPSVKPEIRTLGTASNVASIALRRWVKTLVEIIVYGNLIDDKRNNTRGRFSRAPASGGVQRRFCGNPGRLPW